MGSKTRKNETLLSDFQTFWCHCGVTILIFKNQSKYFMDVKLTFWKDEFY